MKPHETFSTGDCSDGNPAHVVWFDKANNLSGAVLIEPVDTDNEDGQSLVRIQQGGNMIEIPAASLSKVLQMAKKVGNAL